MKSEHTKNNISIFSRDVTKDGSYAYTTDRLSSLMANKRISEAFQAIYPLSGKRLLDLGCGDGTYSLELIRNGAVFVFGIDPAESAVASATEKAARSGLEGKTKFQVGNIYDLKLEQRFDCIILRGVLHHLPDAQRALQCVVPYANNVLIMEPNGTNPIVKLIEKFSKYHIEHEEQSFLFSKIQTWLCNVGFNHTICNYVNLVPMFCPDWMAKLCKIVEPFIEATPIIKNISCGQYIILASK